MVRHKLRNVALMEIVPRERKDDKGGCRRNFVEVTQNQFPCAVDAGATSTGRPRNDQRAENAPTRA